MYNVRDIVMLHEGFGSKVLAIVDTKPGRAQQLQYVAVGLFGKQKRFKLKEAQISRKIGTLDQDAPMISITLGTNPPNKPDDSDNLRWDILRSKKPGDTVVVNWGNKQLAFTFGGLESSRATKFVWNGKNHLGTSYRFPLSIVAV